MYVYLRICFCLKTINTYLKLEIRVVCREFLAFKYIFFCFLDKTDDNLYLYSENYRLKPVFRYTIFICICFGRYIYIYFWKKLWTIFFIKCSQIMELSEIFYAKHSRITKLVSFSEILNKMSYCVNDEKCSKSCITCFILILFLKTRKKKSETLRSIQF